VTQASCVCDPTSIPARCQPAPATVHNHSIVPQQHARAACPLVAHVHNTTPPGNASTGSLLTVLLVRHDINQQKQRKTPCRVRCCKVHVHEKQKCGLASQSAYISRLSLNRVCHMYNNLVWRCQRTLNVCLKQHSDSADPFERRAQASFAVCTYTYSVRTCTGQPYNHTRARFMYCDVLGDCARSCCRGLDQIAFNNNDSLNLQRNPGNNEGYERAALPWTVARRIWHTARCSAQEFRPPSLCPTCLGTWLGFNREIPHIRQLFAVLAAVPKQQRLFPFDRLLRPERNLLVSPVAPQLNIRFLAVFVARRVAEGDPTPQVIARSAIRHSSEGPTPFHAIVTPRQI
jgi:hypothetical protein